MADDGDPFTYPNWWRGIRWGAVTGLVGGLVVGVFCYHLPRSPDEVGVEQLRSDVLVHDSVVVGLVVFCCLFVVIGLLGALRPEIKDRR